MYSTTKALIALIFSLFLCSGISQAQEVKNNFKEWEIGAVFASAEASYYGVHTKFSFPLSPKKHYPSSGISFTAYFDFTGESEPNAELTQDVDMRLIPAVFLGYHLNFKKIDFSVEIPIGISTAITTGTLVNDKIGFKRSYSNTEFLWHFGAAFSVKHQINNNNKVGLFGFIPLVKDIAWTLPYGGIGWTRIFN